MAQAPIRGFIEQFVSTISGIPANQLDGSVPFFSYGFTSLDIVDLARALNAQLDAAISPTAGWDFSTIDTLTAHATACGGAVRPPAVEHSAGVEPIAVIGIGCRFPGASGPAAFFDLLCDGDDPIGEVPADRWNADEFFSPDLSAPARIVSRRGGFLADLDRFDAGFFRMSPREAAQLDPRQRLLLEIAWEAFEDAGIPPLTLAGSDTGVFVATLASNYGSLIFDHHLEIVDAYSGTGNGNSVTANRLSYFFDLHGPSVALDTACSGSLVAVHLAVQSLAAGGMGLALAGGVNVILKPDDSVFFSKTGALSPDGVCRVFDRHANGIVRSEGAGVVVLKPLSRALADGDRVYAVIRSTAVNQDGASNGIMAPNGEAQRRLLRDAYRRVGVPPSLVQYVECHGTGTALGDPIEIQALSDILAEGRPPGRGAVIGSVKSNIGHAEAAAGMAGLIKTTLALHRRVIPGNLHFREPNPLIAFDQVPLAVQRQTGPWPWPDDKLVAGISAFGFAGTNAHIVIEEAPPAPQDASAPAAPYLLALSAQSADSLRASAAAYADRLDTATHPGTICRAAATRRSHLKHRLAVVGATGDALAAKLRAFATTGARGTETSSSVARSDRPGSMAFVFSGQGSQWATMGRRAFGRYRAFRSVIEECDVHYGAIAGRSLIAELSRDPQDSRIDGTEIAQPAIFAVQAALGVWWQSVGLHPLVVVGQSLGEVAAAFCCGALSLKDAMAVVCARSRLMKRAAGAGRTAAVALPVEDVRGRLGHADDGLVVAGVLSPRMTLVSGPIQALDAWLTDASARGVFCRALPGVDLALHGPQMDALRDDLTSVLAAIVPGPSTIPFVSSATGTIVAGEQLGPEYWSLNLRHAFDFRAAFAVASQEGATHFLEINAHPMLASPISEMLNASGSAAAFSSLRRDVDDLGCLLETLGALYANGHTIQWDHVFEGSGRVVDLPTYPWQRERHWFEQLLDGRPAVSFHPPSTFVARDHEETPHPLLGRAVRVGVSTNHHVWETRIGPNFVTIFDGHRVQGAAVLPGSAFVELALAATRQLDLSGQAIHLADLRFVSALALEAERVVQTIVDDRDAAGSRSMRIVSAPPASDDWTTHAIGRLELDTSPLSPAGPQAIADDHEWEPLEVQVHYDRLAQAGLEYRGAFRSITNLERRGAEARGTIARTADDRSSGWICHPALLDACLQLVAVAGDEGSSQDFRLPTSIDAFTLYRALPDRFLCRVGVRTPDRAEPHRLEADLILSDAEGVMLARAEAATFERAGDPYLATRNNIQRWLYEVDWRPAPRRISPMPLPLPAALTASFERGAERLATELELSHYAGQWPLFDRLAVAYVIGALRELDVTLELGADVNPEAAADRARVAPQHLPLWRRLLDILREDAIIDHRGRVAEVPSRSAGALGDEIRTRFPAADAELGLVERAGRALAPMLRGEIDPLQLLFAHEHDDLLERLYRDSTFMRFYNAAIREAIVAAAAAASSDQPLRVLEIGGGTGSTTQHVLPALARLPCEYMFTDVSQRFLDRARTTFGAYDCVSYRTLDIEIDPAAQGFLSERFDVIVAANVLHATANLREALAHARQLLLPGGTLILMEGPPRQRWLDLVVGGTDGWWRFQDDLRVDYPLITEAAWMRALADAGFDDVSPIADPVPGPPQFVIVARSAAAVYGARDYRWLLVGATGSAFGRDLTAQLAASGADLVIVDDASMEPPAVAAALATPGLPWRVVYLRGLTAPHASTLTATLLAEIERELVFGLVELIQSLARHHIDGRLWIVTRNAQAIDDGPAIEVGQAALWGVGRVASTEHPEIWGGLLDLDPAPMADAAAHVIDEIVAGAGEDQLAYRAGRRLAARLVHARVPPNTSSAWSLRRDAAYLITGGLRGLGLAVAERLVALGARHLILVSRTELPPRHRWSALSPEEPHQDEVRAIRRLESCGAEVRVGSFDVAVAEDLGAFLEAYASEARPPIRGVVHCAGLIQDHLLTQMTSAAFAAVSRPKVQGGWLLHEAFKDSPLDFFVLFSSGTSLLGTFGQANYAAANAFIDALAHFRRTLGLPATSINWGVWGEIGIVARLGREDQLAQNGLIEIRPALGLDAFELIVRSGVAQMAAMPTDWAAWRRIYPKGYTKPLFAELFNALDAPPGAAPAADGPLSALRRAAETDRPDAAVAYAAAIVAAALRLPAAEIDLDAPLPALGLDSIMAVEIRNRLESDIGSSLSIVELLQGATVRNIAARLSTGTALGSGAPREGAAPRQGEAPSSTAPAGLAIIRRLLNRAVPLACSPSQEALWIVEASNAERSPVYNVAVAVTLTRRLDPPILRRAIDALIRRHETLRTGFVERDAKPWQVISEEVAVDLVDDDLVRWPEDEYESRAHELAVALAKRPFDLHAAPLARFLLLNGRDRATFVLSVHHLVFDGWSAGVFVRELAACYDAAVRGAAPSLTPLPLGFADYAAWLCAEEREPELARQADFWRNALRGRWDVVDLPIDWPRPARRSYRGAKYAFAIDRGSTAEVRQLGRATSATPFMVFAAALALTLHLESRQHDIVIGTTPSDRERAELAGLIGYFVNLLPLPVRIHDGDTFGDLLARVHDLTLGAFGSQSVPFERVRRSLRAETGLRTPPMQVVLTLQNSPVRLPPIVDSFETLDNGTAKFELVLNIVEHGDTHDGWWEYATDLFRPETVRRLADRFLEILSLVSTRPDLGLADIRAVAAPPTVQPMAAAQFSLPSPIARAGGHEQSGA